jgi:hypothetical protein
MASAKEYFSLDSAPVRIDHHRIIIAKYYAVAALPVDADVFVFLLTRSVVHVTFSGYCPDPFL